MVTQFMPGDSAMLKMLKVTRWALLRGGTFKAGELQARFGCSRSMAWSYYYAWVQVFGKEPPPRRGHATTQTTPGDLSRIDLDSLLEP
jgi:hypothetical protein